jgi:hypothetical protein
MIARKMVSDGKIAIDELSPASCVSKTLCMLIFALPLLHAVSTFQTPQYLVIDCSFSLHPTQRIKIRTPGISG